MVLRALTHHNDCWPPLGCFQMSAAIHFAQSVWRYSNNFADSNSKWQINGRGLDLRQSPLITSSSSSKLVSKFILHVSHSVFFSLWPTNYNFTTIGSDWYSDYRLINVILTQHHILRLWVYAYGKINCCMLWDVSWLKIVHSTAHKVLRMPGLAHFLNVLGFTKTSGKQSSYCTLSL